MGDGFGHESTKAQTTTWFTPRWILNPLGFFDLDPCTLNVRPFDIAGKHFEYDKGGDGLVEDWSNYCRVWCNPPYGPDTGKWLKRMAEHGNGIALVFARTETKAFFNWVWPKATGIFFFNKRISFISWNGKVGGNAGAPSCLISYGMGNARCLEAAAEKLGGKYLPISQ